MCGGGWGWAMIPDGYSGDLYAGTMTRDELDRLAETARALEPRPPLGPDPFDKERRAMNIAAYAQFGGVILPGGSR